MRTGLALILGLSLVAMPAFAQGKTKTSPVEEAVAALEVCEAFAERGVLALEGAVLAGWDAYDEESESPFVAQYAATKDIPNLGWGDMFVLVEGYPDVTLGYCRLDVAQAKGNGEAVIEALAALDRYQGEVTGKGGGHYASLVGTSQNQSLLLTHWDDIGFVIQLTIITPNTASGGQ